jgi:uncharacterized metal-binding protein YceD (DUF177 family)
MSKTPAQQDTASRVLRVRDLSTRTPTRFSLAPNAEEMAEIARELDLLSLRKLRFIGEVTAMGRSDWRLKATIGATVEQACIVTLAPVSARLDDKTERHYIADIELPAEEDAEVEMNENDAIEELGETINLWDTMIESLALVLPQYPRATDAALGELNVTEPGKDAMTDQDAKPFAGLAALKSQLEKGSNKE